MKCTIPEISWHNRDPVFSVDVQPKLDDTLDFYRIATAGSDTHVVIWHIRIQQNGLATVEFAADLQRHQRAVNVVRFSPSGEFLASGDDDAAIILWKQKTDQDLPELPSGDAEACKEQWLSVKTLKAHVNDVYDLCWSADSLTLISGSVDNTAVLWDVKKGRNIEIFREHTGFVQGVTMDPKGQFAATLCSDRTCRIYNLQTKKCISKICKSKLPVPEGSPLSGIVVRLFHDDTLKSFFRRLTFSPGGEILIVPSGIIENPESNKTISATHVFARHKFSRPVLYLPSPEQHTIAVKCCPVLFKLRQGGSMFALPYRIVFAVATQTSVHLYDTQQPEPFGLISNIHYTRLTDLSWSSDGRMLIAASTDGYCSIISFSGTELGVPYDSSEVVEETPDEIDINRRLARACSESPKRELPLLVQEWQSRPVPVLSEELSPNRCNMSSQKLSPSSRVNNVGCNINNVISNSSCSCSSGVHSADCQNKFKKSVTKIDVITINDDSDDEVMKEECQSPIDSKDVIKEECESTIESEDEVMKEEFESPVDSKDEILIKKCKSPIDSKDQVIKEECKSPVDSEDMKEECENTVSNEQMKGEKSCSSQSRNFADQNGKKSEEDCIDRNESKVVVKKEIMKASETEEMDIDKSLSPKQNSIMSSNSTPKQKTPRRVQLITLASPKGKKKLL